MRKHILVVVLRLIYKNADFQQFLLDELHSEIVQTGLFEMTHITQVCLQWRRFRHLSYNHHFTQNPKYMYFESREKKILFYDNKIIFGNYFLDISLI